MRRIELFDVLSAVCLASVLAFGSQNTNTIKISGRVEELDSGIASRVSGAKIVFSGPGGLSIAAITNENGEYAATLPSRDEYTATVTANGFCAIHRPRFTPVPFSLLKFDFTITSKCPGDVIVMGDPELLYETPIPAYFEETIPFGTPARSSLIISFGKRTKSAHRIDYAPLTLAGGNMAGSKAVVLPVTLSFGTYTIRADDAELNRDSKVLIAQGEVFIADGSNRPPSKRSCVALKLSEPTPRIEVCKER